MSKQNSHYYDRLVGAVVKRPNDNPYIVSGRNAGRKQRKKDKDALLYPRPGLPISRDGRDRDWIEGYQRGYYQDLKDGRPLLLDAKRVKISVTADRGVLDAADAAGVSRSEAIDLGLKQLIKIAKIS